MQQGRCSDAAGKDPVRAGTYSAACEARGPLYLGVAGAPSSQEAKRPRSQASKHPARAPPGVASGPLEAVVRGPRLRRSGASGRPVHDVAAAPSMESVVPSLLRAS